MDKILLFLVFIIFMYIGFFIRERETNNSLSVAIMLGVWRFLIEGAGYYCIFKFLEIIK